MDLLELAVLTSARANRKKSDIASGAIRLLGIAPDLGSSREALVAIDRLVATGQMRREGPGMYQITDSGRSATMSALPALDTLSQAIRYGVRA